jgi:hypothetical protein
MRIAAAAILLTLGATSALAQQGSGARAPTAADGFTIHVTAPHLYQGHEMGPVHHYCKPISPEPVIVCLLFDSPDPSAPLTGVEYVIAKSVTRSLVTLGTWNANFHDHAVEIATGRVQVLDLPPAEAKKVADLVATTDGIIFHLWPVGDRIPTGTMVIAQAVGHRPLSAEEYARSAHKTNDR